MAIIKVKKVPKQEHKIDVDDILARFCYYYPQYTFKQAKQMPAIRIRKMLKSARAEHRANMYQFLYELVQTIPVANSKEHYNKMISRYEDLMNK